MDLAPTTPHKRPTVCEQTCKSLRNPLDLKQMGSAVWCRFYYQTLLRIIARLGLVPEAPRRAHRTPAGNDRPFALDAPAVPEHRALCLPWDPRGAGRIAPELRPAGRGAAWQGCPGESCPGGHSLGSAGLPRVSAPAGAASFARWRLHSQRLELWADTGWGSRSISGTSHGPDVAPRVLVSSSSHPATPWRWDLRQALSTRRPEDGWASRCL